jgi:uncharacterized protein
VSNRIDVVLVAGGKWHDIDYARRELLTLLDDPRIRTRVESNWEAVDLQGPAAPVKFLVSYTCDVRPSEVAQQRIRDWVLAGGRWLALHGTNAALDVGLPGGVEAPRCFPLWADTLGSQFIAHPPIAPYRVEPVREVHPDLQWLVANIEPFDATDELYLSEYAPGVALEPLLATTWSGHARGFAEADWSLETRGTDTHLVLYHRALGDGAILYNTLGHCRSHYDMVPMKDFHPTIDRCAWDVPQYRELLRRGILWASGESPAFSASVAPVTNGHN